MPDGEVWERVAVVVSGVMAYLSLKEAADAIEDWPNAVVRNFEAEIDRRRTAKQEEVGVCASASSGSTQPTRRNTMELRLSASWCISCVRFMCECHAVHPHAVMTVRLPPHTHDKWHATWPPASRCRHVRRLSRCDRKALSP